MLFWKCWNKRILQGLESEGNMIHEIKEVTDKDSKSAVCNVILRALPNWFGIEASIIDYVNQVRDMPFFSAVVSGEPVGFAAIKEHNQYTAEICVMGILRDYHRQGIGRQLIQYGEEYCMATGKEFLTVKTLDESRASKSYEKTRQFYLAIGFRPLEVFPLYWDKDNPCLFLAKCITRPAG